MEAICRRVLIVLERSSGVKCSPGINKIEADVTSATARIGGEAKPNRRDASPTKPELIQRFDLEMKLASALIGYPPS